MIINQTIMRTKVWKGNIRRDRLGIQIGIFVSYMLIYLYIYNIYNGMHAYILCIMYIYLVGSTGVYKLIDREFRLELHDEYLDFSSTQYNNIV